MTLRLGIMVGLQCSGKSTIAKGMIKEGWIVLNPDTFRQVYSGTNKTLLDKLSEKKIWDSIYLTAKSLLVYGHEKVLIDGVFSSKWTREIWVNLAKEFGIELEIYMMPFDVDLCIRRNRRIARFVDDYGTPTDKVILNTARRFQSPDSTEGRIINVKNKVD